MDKDNKLDAETTDAAKTMVVGYQSIIDKIRDGRYDAGYQVNQEWNDWYNSLMGICFAIGGALVAVAATVTFKITSTQILLWVSSTVFIADGLYILLTRKNHLEKESIGLITMGYEQEYYALVVKDRVLDVLAGNEFKQDEYTSANASLLSNSLESLDTSYEESRSIDQRMDVMVLVFILGLLLLALASVSSRHLLSILRLMGTALYVGLLFIFRSFANKPKEAITERDKWLAKITKERKDYSKKYQKLQKEE